MKAFLARYNSRLVPLAERIVELPRWREVVGIIGKETTFCQAGVGDGRRNNCGAIGGDSRPASYITAKSRIENQYLAIKAVSSLLVTKRYANKTITQMNGIYCQDQKRAGLKCVDWDRHIEAFMVELDWEISELEQRYLNERYQEKKIDET